MGQQWGEAKVHTRQVAKEKVHWRVEFGFQARHQNDGRVPQNVKDVEEQNDDRKDPP